MSEKVAMFSDPHLGCHQNDTKWHKISLDYAHWICKTVDPCVKKLFCLGDIFNNRDEIGVSTIEIAEQFFSILASRFELILIAGNHDSFYKDHAGVSSISILNNKNNIRVVTKTTEEVVIDGKKILCVPWGLENEIQNHSDLTAIFGHFEINTFKRTYTDICQNGVNSTYFLKHAKSVFSGHFHLRDERVYNNGRIVYVGSPYQITWADAGSEKGVYLYEPESDTYEFIQNDFSPKHIEMDADKIFTNKNLDVITGNFIKLVTKPDFDYKKLDDIFSKIENLKPLDVVNSFSKQDIVTNSSKSDYNAVDIKESLKNYVNNIETNVEKSQLVDVMLEIYDEANG